MNRPRRKRSVLAVGVLVLTAASARAAASPSSSTATDLGIYPPDLAAAFPDVVARLNGDGRTVAASADPLATPEPSPLAPPAVAGSAAWVRQDRRRRVA